MLSKKLSLVSGLFENRFGREFVWKRRKDRSHKLRVREKERVSVREDSRRGTKDVAPNK